MTPFYTIYPLGDAAITVELGNHIDAGLNRQVLDIQQWLLQRPFTGFKDCIAAYGSLTVVYDPVCIKRKIAPATTVYEWVKAQVETASQQADHPDEAQEMPPVIRIPVCYEEGYGIDMDLLATKKQLSKESIVRLHTAPVYRVYMIGFLPGFAYLASVAGQLATPRKDKPVMVAPGSVGIAGEQTGIYPLRSPGGWHIIGRTPLRLFDAGATPPVKLKAGDEVQFYAISKENFLQLQAQP